MPCESSPVPGPASSAGSISSRAQLSVVAAVVFLFVGSPNLRLRDYAIAAQPDEVVNPRPSLLGVLFEKARQPGSQPAHDIWADGVVEHRRGTDLNRSASKEKIIDRMLEQ